MCKRYVFSRSDHPRNNSGLIGRYSQERKNELNFVIIIIIIIIIIITIIIIIIVVIGGGGGGGGGSSSSRTELYYT
jgi:hypothetical protein